MNKYYSELLGATVYSFENTILFYGGIFSQWAECDFNIFIGGEEYSVNCAEQAMMLNKAHFFKDDAAFKKILEYKDPRAQKAIGRTIKNFDADKWDEVAFELVVSANVAKFAANKSWRELLFLTYPLTLVEASPTDRIWGIGYGENNPNIFQEKENWGRNLLGHALVLTRNVLLEKF